MTTTTDVGLDEVLDAILTASRSLVAISAQSIASVAEDVDLMQFRILVVLASHGGCSLSDVSAALGLHLSTASRSCDRLVRADLIRREARADDRRNLDLTLTPAGERLVGRVLRRRRAALAPMLEQLSMRRQRRLASALRDLAAAAGEPSDRALWAMGWTTEPES